MKDRCGKCGVLFCIYPKPDDSEYCVVCAYNELKEIRRDWITASEQWKQWRKELTK